MKNQDFWKKWKFFFGKPSFLQYFFLFFFKPSFLKQMKDFFLKKTSFLQNNMKVFFGKLSFLILFLKNQAFWKTWKFILKLLQKRDTGERFFSWAAKSSTVYSSQIFLLCTKLWVSGENLGFSVSLSNHRKIDQKLTKNQGLGGACWRPSLEAGRSALIFYLSKSWENP